jgi:Skp family chaperone for outer membrane proteins
MMITSIRRDVLATVAALGLAFAAPLAASAQQMVPSVVAVVDYETILRDSSAGQGLRQQISAKREAFQAEVEKAEQELRAAEQDLKNQQSVLSAEAFAQKRQEFQARVAEVQKFVQGRKQTLDQALAKGEEAIRQATVGILGEMAKERGFNIVLPLRQVLLVESSYNVTEAVLTELNRRHPTIAVEFGAEP